MSSIVNRDRPKAGGSKFVGVRLTDSTLDGLKKIQTAFQMKYPEGKYPCLSHLLSIVLDEYIKTVGQDPEQLQIEIEDFQARYANQRRGLTTKEQV